MKFIPFGSLPRSGSTLLSNILSQNNQFHVSHCSDLSRLISSTKNFIEDHTAYQQIDYDLFNNCVKNFCIHGTGGWVNTLCPKDKILVDKSRSWLIDIDYVYKIFEELKMIILIRDLRGVVNSFEKIHNNSWTVNRNIFDYNFETDFQRQHVDYILNLWFLRQPLISLKELLDLNRTYLHNLLIIKYEDLLTNPLYTMEKIYEFLDLPNFKHDFDSIEGFEHNDNPHQPYGCHKIFPKLQKLKTIYQELNDENLNYIIEKHNWFYQEFYPEVL